jgi:hypothetical protein
MTEPTYTIDQLMQMICYTRHSQSSRDGKKPYTKRESLLNGFLRACDFFKSTHGNDSLRKEYVLRRNNNTLTKDFLDRIFPYFPKVTSSEGLPLKFIDYSLAPTHATKAAVPSIDLAYTARVVEASEQRELEKELAEIYLTIDAIDLSSDPFPVDLGEAARWLGYSGEPRTAKASAKDALMKLEYKEDSDYRRRNVPTPVPQGGFVVSEQIRLTAECFKDFCLQSGAKRGPLIRKYFMEAEQRFRAAVKGESLQTSIDPANLENVVRRVARNEAEQQLTAAVSEIGESLDNGVSTVLTAIEIMQQQFNQQLEVIKTELQEKTPENKRRQFPLSVQKRVGRLFYEYTRGGGCLGNRNIQVIDANGDKISPMQFDHWDGNESRNVYDNCVPMSLELHKRKTAGRLTAEERKRIEGFIDWMRMIEDDTEETQLGLSIF